MKISKLFQKYLKITTKVFENYFKSISKVFEKYLKMTSKVFQKYLKITYGDSVIDNIIHHIIFHKDRQIQPKLYYIYGITY